MPTLPHLDELTVLPDDPIVRDMPWPENRTRRLPAWLKRPIPSSAGNYFTKSLVSELGLETICESALCPNRGMLDAADGHVHDPW